MTRRTAVEREARKLGEYLDDEALRRIIEEAMRRIERATLSRVRRDIEDLRGTTPPVERHVLDRVLACCRPERKR